MKEIANQLVKEIQQEVLDELLAKLRPELLNLKDRCDTSYRLMKEAFDAGHCVDYTSFKREYDSRWEYYNAFNNVVNIIECFEL